MQQIALRAIRLYQVLLAPLCALLGAQCRYHPSCSAYAYEAFQHHRGWRAAWFSIRRFVRCHPYRPGGFDPVPQMRVWSERRGMRS
ncbi:MAG: membrane protein insertion efficiency factor YidD [Deltaproteobacteria bacterium]|nr:membrane protein insertion efficiency factor YidD [Deltaproteobacteria bacterium]